jgi:hypothetical protein
MTIKNVKKVISKNGSQTILFRVSNAAYRVEH